MKCKLTGIRRFPASRLLRCVLGQLFLQSNRWLSRFPRLNRGPQQQLPPLRQVYPLLSTAESSSPHGVDSCLICRRETCWSSYRNHITDILQKEFLTMYVGLNIETSNTRNYSVSSWGVGHSAKSGLATMLLATPIVSVLRLAEQLVGGDDE